MQKGASLLNIDDNGLDLTEAQWVMIRSIKFSHRIRELGGRRNSGGEAVQAW